MLTDRTCADEALMPSDALTVSPYVQEAAERARSLISGDLKTLKVRHEQAKAAYFGHKRPASFDSIDAEIEFDLREAGLLYAQSLAQVAYEDALRAAVKSQPVAELVAA